MYDYECYQKEQLIKEMLLLENHLTTNKCEHCIRKHKTTVIALAEETIKMTSKDKEKALFQQLKNIPNDVSEIRELRLKLMDMTPMGCGLKVKNSSSKLSRCVLDVKKTEWCKEKR